MDVTRVSPYLSPQPVERTQEMNSPGRSENKSEGVQETAVPKDRVQLSNHCREVDMAKKVTMQQDEIRMEKVEQLRHAIKSGTYVVEPDKLAEKMLGEIW